MITEHEINTIKLDPLKKDFYQIWNELLDTAQNLSNRWDPASTNEADPGIVLLKVLTAVADKLFYNADKNILEAYMPSATQEESFRKLCDMLGYSMKYYQSATTRITISYIGDVALGGINYITIPKYTVITNSDNDVTYTTIAPRTLNSNVTTDTVDAIEGMLESCQVNGNEIITVANLDDNNRFYFPETQIAENGIFVSNVLYVQQVNDETQTTEVIATEGESWVSVDNLNTQKINSKVFKFGYDSREKLPYIQFPEDVSNVIGDGLFIKYIRTNGVNGNIAARTLNKFQTIDNLIKSGKVEDEDLEQVLTVTNASNTTNGANKETINSAYNNYKRTIGTFDTLVTCRDYMNKIYQMMKKDLAPEISTDTTPLVSNIIVSDIRDDINSSYTLCSFDAFGMNYIDVSKRNSTTGNDLISSFDLKLYPFTVISNTTLKSEYENSFKYSDTNIDTIEELLETNKTISHVFNDPHPNEVACIKNYLKLNCKITTNYKITKAEEGVILKNIYASLYDAFHMRQLEFGEEIPYDSILDVIKNADSRIKNISLDEPEIYTKFALVDGTELDFSTDETGVQIYDQLALRNVLAGKISLFNYNEDFKTDLTETKDDNYSDVFYPTNVTIDPTSRKVSPRIDTVTTSFTLPTSALEPDGYKLLDNEVIQFSAPNLKTVMTYPAYVNYYLYLYREEEEGQEIPHTKDHKSVYMIDKNTEYELKQGERLCINYTPASDDGEEASAESIEYNEGTIVRFNFNVYDSQVAADETTVDYSKKSGYSFEPQIPGMFTFGVKEQVEIRELAIVQLGDAADTIIYVYWQRSDDDTNLSEDVVMFEFDEDYDSSSDIYTSYTLKEGEYFYYTDRNKLDIAIYGSGTKIHRNGDITLVKYRSNESLTSEDILIQGLSASIPWVTVPVSSTSNITVQEFQYITLTNGDTLKTIDMGNKAEIDSDLTDVVAATYKFATGTTVVPLSRFSFKVEGRDVNWQVRAKLDLNIGPTVTQTIHQYDTITIHLVDVAQGQPDEKVFWAINGESLSLKANYPVVSSSITTNVTVWKMNQNTGKMTDIFSDFKLKAFKTVQLQNNVVGNFGDNLTKISLDSEDVIINPTTGLVDGLQTLIPNNNFGLMMFYYVQSGAEPLTALKFKDVDGNYVDGKIFNHYLTHSYEEWWSGLKVGNVHKLKSGLNIVDLDNTIASVEIYSLNTKTDPSTQITTYAKSSDIIIFSNLDLVPTDNPLNPKIDYRDINAGSPYEQILEDIRAMDPDYNFYYNALLDNSNVIDLNENNSDETLSNPYTWYNYNNVNNKFVISEIDADYLSTGITIAKSSKL